jgi:hypothetical protein
MKTDISSLILYHGGIEKVEIIDLSKSRNKVDFGRGFYTTASYTQAVRWSELKSSRNKTAAKNKAVSKYSIKNITGLSIKEFASADREWLEFVVNNRTGEISHDFDMVIGPIANDMTLLVVNAYMSGFYGAGDEAVSLAISLLKPDLLEDQYAFCTEAAVSKLSFEGCNYL